LKKKVKGGCALPGADIQKLYAPKCGQGKTIIDLFRDFFYKNRLCPCYLFMNFIPVKVSTLCAYLILPRSVNSKIASLGLRENRISFLKLMFVRAHCNK
jgi:hypothetical protein